MQVLDFISCSSQGCMQWYPQRCTVDPHYSEFVFVNLLVCWNVFVTPRSVLAVLLESFTDQRQSSKTFQLPDARDSSWSQTRWCSVFLFQLSYCRQCPFHSLFSATSFTFLCSLLVILLFKKAPSYSAKVLSSVPKTKHAVIGLKEKVGVLGKLHSGMNIVLLATSSFLMNRW